MKKKKWLINFSTLALALCVMAFGVYAAKSATLSTSGSIGFISHDADVTVVGTITGAMRGKNLGYAPVSNKTYTAEETGDVAWADRFTTINDDGVLNEQDYLRQTDPATKWTFGDIYFDDMNQTGDAVSDTITCTFTVTNYSDFNILVKVVDSTNLEQEFNPSINGLEVITTQAIISANKGTPSQEDVTITFKLTTEGKNNGVSLIGISPTLSITRTNLTPPTKVTENGWNGYLITEGTNDGKFQITQMPQLQDGESIVIPEQVLTEEGVFDVVLNSTEEGYDGYVDDGNKFVVTSIPQNSDIESTSSNSLNATNKIQTTAANEEIYVPNYILYGSNIYETTVCSTNEGWIIVDGYLQGVPNSEDGKKDIVIPSIIKDGGVNKQITKLRANYDNCIQNINKYSYVTISKGIKGIYSYSSYKAFGYSYNLYSIDLGDVEIIDDAQCFKDCYKLVQVKKSSALNFSFPNSICEVINTDNNETFKNSLTTDENGLIKYNVTSCLDSSKIGLYLLGSERSNIAISAEMMGNIKGILPSAFSRDENLQSIEIPSSVTLIGESAFLGCSSLSTIEIPSSVTIIGERAFQSCSSLRTITFADNSQIETIGLNAFFGCPAVSNYDSNGICYLGSSSNPSLILYTTKSDQNFVNVTIGQGCKIIYNDAFVNRTTLLSIEIPSSVITIGNNAFSGCENLNSITFADDSQLKNLGENVFHGCSAIKNYDSAGLCYIGSNSNPHLIFCGSDSNKSINDLVINSQCKLIIDEAFFRDASNRVDNIEIPEGVIFIGKQSSGISCKKALIINSPTIAATPHKDYMSGVIAYYIYINDNITNFYMDNGNYILVDDYTYFPNMEKAGYKLFTYNY